MSMQWQIPGTTLTGEREEASTIYNQLSGLFLAGGLSLSQVAGISGLECHTIQNWVRRGFLSPPKNKKYTLTQLCRILNINALKGILPLEEITQLMGYINGSLSDESDDLVDEALLFSLFVRLAAQPQDVASLLEEVYREPIPGAKEKLASVLNIMCTVWEANCKKAEAEQMLAALK